MIMAYMMALILRLEGAALATSEATFIDDQEFMSIAEVERKYGKKPFSNEKFKRGSVEERASMVAHLIKSKKFIGKKPEEVREQLGPYAGHFWNDNIPTYIIEEGWNKEGDTWQVVFLLDAQGNVNEVKVHKNCCKKN